LLTSSAYDWRDHPKAAQKTCAKKQYRSHKKIPLGLRDRAIRTSRKCRCHHLRKFGRAFCRNEEMPTAAVGQQLAAQIGRKVAPCEDGERIVGGARKRFFGRLDFTLRESCVQTRHADIAMRVTPRPAIRAQRWQGKGNLKASCRKLTLRPIAYKMKKLCQWRNLA
jgi:hypothetical protein